MLETKTISRSLNGNEIAIIGMAGRFPKAANLAEFWRNLYEGVEAVTFFTTDELRAAGVPAALLNHPNYVRANPVFEEIESFDAAFFGYSPGEAQIMDPQQRLFLECSWQALEHAGYDPHRYSDAIGVYAATSSSTYLYYNLLRSRRITASTELPLLLYGNEKDFLATRVSYKLGLRGPSFTVQSACSSSLAALHLACQGLLSGDCNMALAGGVCLNAQPHSGYLYQREGYRSPDGHCRAFDAKGEGTIGGSGLGIIVLRRLDEALAEGDSIYAVIKGTAINNDGDTKIGYSAPSIQGQAAVIHEALAVAQVHPETISYIEAHGTGTPIGDPIEVAALRQVYAAQTSRIGYCALGSLKTNLGHMDAAAGVAGVLKTTLALQNECLPPHLHYTQPNPQIDFAHSPFYVNAERRAWPRSVEPRRAGVSSFGVGGTNAHVILEEAPLRPPRPRVDHSWQILPLAAKTATALQTMQANLAAELQMQAQTASPPELADIAYTLQVGRAAFAQRGFVVCRTLEEAGQALESSQPGRWYSGPPVSGERPLVFLFPGGGSQYPNMGRELYEHEPLFRETVQRCASLLAPHINYDIVSRLYPPPTRTPDETEHYQHGFVSLSLLFVVEYALAHLLMAWGLKPSAMLGHSLGEHVAACLAGVFTLEEALRLVAFREQLAAQLQPGVMLSVLATEAELTPLLNESLSLAAINSRMQCVVSGDPAACAELEKVLQERTIFYRRLDSSVAGHSVLLEPVMGQLAEFIARMPLRSPRIPFISNVTGTWIKPEEATSPDYWVRHLRQTVRFSDGVQEILKEPNGVLLEVGPGQTLSLLIKNLVAQQQGREATVDATRILATMRQAQEPVSDIQYLLTSLGQLWLAGVPIQWSRLHASQTRWRIPLPTYPFERQRYWVDPDHDTPMGFATEAVGPDETEPVTPESARPAICPDSPSESVPSKQKNSYVPPSNEIEETLVVIWQEVLGLKTIGVTDNFFELGGDSLIGLRLVTRVRETFSIDLPLKAFFENPTITQLAEVVDLHLLEIIENLSEDEVQALYAKELGEE